MARFTFGGNITHLVTTADETLGGALKVAPATTLDFYDAAAGGSLVEDYLLDADNDGTFETAVTTIESRATGYLPAFQGPDGVEVLFYDPDPNDGDSVLLRLTAWDASSAGVPDATTTTAGKVELADAAEALAGSDDTKAMTPADVKVVADDLKDWTTAELADFGSAEVVRAALSADGDPVNNSTTPILIPGFVVTSLVNQEWFIASEMDFDGAANADLKVQLKVPAGSLVHGVIVGPTLTATDNSTTQRLPLRFGTGISTSLVLSFGALGAGTDALVSLQQVRVQVGSTAGTIEVRFSQNTGQASNTFAKAGSWFFASRVD